MHFKILTEDTHKIVHRPNIRHTEDSDTPNARLYLFDGEEPLTKFIISESDNSQDQMMLIIKSAYMIGRIFLGQLRDDWDRHRAIMVKEISNHAKNLESNSECITFSCSFNDTQYNEIYEYDDIILISGYFSI